ncbi:MAG: hypothetical protein J7K26_00630 [Candidatus Aenigmarchaeota archaeon]|nr:hypothetical protein [Candidatus Aenigmarchaeota archaeon]
MFHPGVVIEIFKKGKDVKSIDNSVQVTLEMWDENILTFNISTTLAKYLKENDIVLVDYSPISEKLPAPKHKIVKILKGKKGIKMWNKYKEFLRKRKPKQTTNKVVVKRPSQQYIG